MPIGILDGFEQVEARDSGHAHNPRTGTNFNQDASGNWIDSATGRLVSTVPIGILNGFEQVEARDSGHAHNPRTGQNFVRVPCPRPNANTPPFRLVRPSNPPTPSPIPPATAAAPVGQRPGQARAQETHLISPLTGKQAKREEQADLDKLQALYNAGRQAQANLKTAATCGGNIKLADAAFHAALDALTKATEQYVRDYSDTLYGPKLNPAGHQKLEDEKGTLGAYLTKHARPPVEASCHELPPIPKGPSAPPKIRPMPVPHPPM